VYCGWACKVLLGGQVFADIYQQYHYGKVSLYNKILNSTVVFVGEKLVPQSPYFTTLH
jgi:hypothetical protein